MQDTPDTAPSRPVLDYGTQSTLRRRLWRGVIVCGVLAAIAGGLWFAVPRLIHAFKLKSAIAECNAWAEKARTGVLPEGTVLYSETHADFVDYGNGVPQWTTSVSSNGTKTGRHVSFAVRHASLREVSYRKGGIPLLSDFRSMLYVHEHPLWLAPPGSPPPVFSVSYIGLSSTGNPQFGVTARMFPLDAQGRSNMVGGIATAPLPGRPLTSLRLFAGRPHPADPTRFSIPFSCDGGSGRFNFQTDTDASDGGDVVPGVTISWDPSPTTQPG